MPALLPALLLAAAASAAPAPKTAPMVPPLFHLDEVQNAPFTMLDVPMAFDGNVLYLEFWATWCQPCVAGIPRMNRLLDAFKGQPVKFLAVTDEEGPQVAAFRKTHPMKAWVGVDPSGKAFQAYHVDERPTGFLIGKDGALLAQIEPDELTEKDLRDALAGRFEPRPIERRQDKPRVGDALFLISVAAASGEPGMSMGDGMLEATALPFGPAMALIWDVDQDLVVVEKPPVPAFNFSLRAPRASFAAARGLLQQAVEDTFDVSVSTEKGEVRAFALELIEGPGAPRPAPGDPRGKPGLVRYGGGRLLGTATMAQVARGLRSSAGHPVFDETGLKGAYAFDLEWDPRDPSAMERALATEGLRLQPVRRLAELLRVAPRRKER